MKTFYLIALSVLLIVSGCGKRQSEPKKNVTISPDQITNLLENQKFECASIDGGNCPEGISRLFILDKIHPSNSTMCTGFLVASNQLVTNHHCVSTQLECDDTYVTVYNGRDYEIAKCNRIIAAEDDGKPVETKEIDFSVIELDRHLRTSRFFPISNKKIQLNKFYTAWVVDHIDLYKGRITELFCKSTEVDAYFQLSHCPLILGNSGSPLVDSSGEVVGVMWGVSQGQYIVNEQTPLMRRRSLNIESYATVFNHFLPFIHPNGTGAYDNQ